MSVKNRIRVHVMLCVKTYLAHTSANVRKATMETERYAKVIAVSSDKRIITLEISLSKC